MKWTIKHRTPRLAATWEIWHGDALICEGLVKSDAEKLSHAHNAEIEKIEKTIHRIAESVTNNAGAIQSRIGELERTKSC